MTEKCIADEERDRVTVDILSALTLFLAAGGSRASAHRIARETLFFIYEGGNKEKYERHPKSKAARTQNGKNQVVYDHAVPLKLWIGTILDDEKLSLTRFRRIMADWLHVRIITKDENRLLNALKLHSSMPDDWDGHDVEARYTKARIEF